MAVKPGKKRRGLPLAVGIFLIVLLIVALTAGTAVVMTAFTGQETAREELSTDLVGSLSVQTTFQQHRYRQLQLISRIFSTDPLLTSYLAEATEAKRVEAIFDLVSEYQNILSFDLAMVLDVNGRLLARTDDPAAGGDDFSERALVAVALEEEIAFGVWQEGEKLYHAAAVPLVTDFEIVGYVIAGFAINDALALQIGRIGGTSSAYVSSTPTGPAVAASTLDAAQRPELIEALREQGEAINRVRTRGDTVDGVELDLGGTRYLAALSPLKDAANASVGAAVALTSIDERLAGYRRIRWVMLAAGGAALLVGALLAAVVARAAQGPLRRLAGAAEEIGGGNLEADVPAASGDAGRIAGALRTLASEIREKRSLEAFVGHLQRGLPEPAKGEALSRPQARKLSLMAVEMRRYANPKIGYDAEESMGRFSRDVRRVATAVTAHKGRLSALFGHRLLATFEGEGGGQRALAAATEALHVLSERENVFDEPDPPAVALTAGNVVTGSVSGAERPHGAVAGLPVQQLESLLREATPGELFLSKQLFAEVADGFRQQGVEIAAQRGVVSPQPLYVVPLEAAAKVTGVDVSAEVGSAFPGEKVSLAEITPGAMIGGRFEVLTELGAGRLGTVWKARDRDRGELVALKLLKPEVVADPAQLDRLRTVIRQWRSIRHPNLVAVFDFAEAGGLPYISSEYVRGMSLRYVIRESRQVPVIPALRILRQVLAGLDAAHGQGLLHGGLKPEDVLIEPAGGVKLMDFGLAAPGRAAYGGAPQYLAPEQLEGQAGDARADVYACGVIFYELLTGQLPYAGANPSELKARQLEEDAAAPSEVSAEVPGELDPIVLRCLAKTPDGRYPTVAAVLEDLAELRG